MRKPLRLLKKLPSILDKAITSKDISQYTSLNLYFEDESRFGLFTRSGKAITAKGVKPVCPYQHKFDNTYLFGSFSPVNGDSFLLDLPYCNTEMFQLYLNEFSKKCRKEFKIILLDNGTFHKAKKLQIPENICLIFLPPYSPELNAAEKVWWMLKKEIKLKVFETLIAMQNKLHIEIIKLIKPSKIKKLTGYKYSLRAFQTII